MEPLTFFDCNCSTGRRAISNPGSFHKARDLVMKMEHYRIKKALVFHSMSREYNPVIGNSMLMDEIKDYSCLYPVWAVMHHHTGEFPEPQILMQQLKENNIRAVRLFPSASDHNFSISDWNCGELFFSLEKHRIPLMIGLDQLSWNELQDLCCCHPELRVVLLGVNYRIDRNIYALLEKFGHIYMETGGYKVNNGIEEICRRFGAGRLLFGSSMPVLSGGAAVSMINYADISENEKRLIAWGNLESLLGGVCI